MRDQQCAYSDEFRLAIQRSLERKTYLPPRGVGPEAVERSTTGRLHSALEVTCPEIAYHCGRLEGARLLDFGCGDGSSLVALALYFGEDCSTIGAFDTDEQALELSRHRLREHGLTDRATVYPAVDVHDLKALAGTFDLVLMNAVLEHIPLSIDGLRRRTVRALFDMLNPQGYLVITETPNRLWPIDCHSTGMWWTPWARPGSERVYRQAVRRGEHIETPEATPGPLALEERGAWGATYWEIMSYLDPGAAVCVNRLPAHDRHVYYRRPTTWRRRAFEAVAYVAAARLLRAPMTALAPYLTNLVVQKRQAGGARGREPR